MGVSICNDMPQKAWLIEEADKEEVADEGESKPRETSSSSRSASANGLPIVSSQEKRQRHREAVEYGRRA